MDVAFVSKAIQEQKLDPMPVTGFHARDNYWQETARWRRVVEEYSWGNVMFLDDVERGMHATVIAIGKLDLETGRVLNGTSYKQIPIGWYSDLTSGLKSLATQVQLQIPPCLGFHENDHVCDGGMNVQTKRAEPPCSWRSRCTALQGLAVDQGRLQEDILRGKSPEQIVQLTTRLLERKQGHDVTAPSHPAPKAQPAKQEGTKAKPPAEGPGLEQIVAEATKEVATACSTTMAADEMSAAAGELFIIDRTEHSDYISVYKAQGPKLRPKAVCSFRLRRRIGGFRVQLPLPQDSPLLEGIVPGEIGQWKDGAFQIVVNDVIPGQRRMDHIKNVMAALVRSDG